MRVGATGPTTTVEVTDEVLFEDTESTTTSAPVETTVPALEVPPTTTATPAVPTTARVPRPRPTTTTRVASPTTAPARSGGGDLGQVVTLPGPGVYAVELASGAATRLGEPRPFDLAGSVVLTAEGGSIMGVPVEGGERQERYAIPGADRIDWFEAADDGTAAIRVSINGDLRARLFGPTGELLVADLPAAREFEWSGDNSLLVVHNHQGLLGYRRDGRSAWGPTAIPEWMLRDLRVSPDGALISGQFDAHVVRLLDVASGQWRETGVWREVSFGPGPRLLGQPTPPPAWNGRDPLGLVTWSVTDGSSTRYAGSGSEPSWSADGGHAVHVAPPVTGTFSGTNFSLRVRDGSGAARFTLSSNGRGFGRDGNIFGVGPALTGPRWSTDGRYVVVVVP